ncbi:MAG: DUF4389 domain-containing protein [Acidimicrobiales bacterium]
MLPAPYPLNVEVPSHATVARWRPLLNWLLVIPHYIWLGILQVGLEILVIISWFVILFTGRLPENWGSFIVGVLRYQWRVVCFLYAWTEVYPGFSPPTGYPDPGGYPAILQMVPDQRRNRLTVLFRAFMVIPQFIVLYFVGIAASVVLLICWFVVLFTGRWPDGMRDFCIGYYRWYTRTEAYYFLVTDVYPPFRLGP